MADLQTTGHRIAEVRRRISNCELDIAKLYLELKDLKRELKQIDQSVLDDVFCSAGTHDLYTGKSHPLNDGLTDSEEGKDEN